MRGKYSDIIAPLPILPGRAPEGESFFSVAARQTVRRNCAMCRRSRLLTDRVEKATIDFLLAQPRRLFFVASRASHARI
jgi:hypothetical protein